MPVNLMEDEVPLEFDLAIGVRPTDAVLKYVLDYALEDKRTRSRRSSRITACRSCNAAAASSPATSRARLLHASRADRFEARPDLASPDQLVTEEKLENWLAEAPTSTKSSQRRLATDRDRIKFLVEKGADVNKLDSQGDAPLTAPPAAATTRSLRCSSNSAPMSTGRQ